MQHEDERTDTPCFAITLVSVALRAELVSLRFLCSFLLLLHSPDIGSCSIGMFKTSAMQLSASGTTITHYNYSALIDLYLITAPELFNLQWKHSHSILISAEQVSEQVTQAFGSPPCQNQTCKGRFPAPELQGRFVKLWFPQKCMKGKLLSQPSWLKCSRYSE